MATVYLAEDLKHGRKVALTGRSMIGNVDTARELGWTMRGASGDLDKDSGIEVGHTAYQRAEVERLAGGRGQTGQAGVGAGEAAQI